LDLQYDFYIAGTPEQVWQVIVNPDMLKQIYGGSILESSFEVGAPYRYVGPGKEGDQTVHVYGTILEYEPSKTLSMTTYTGSVYYPNAAQYDSRTIYRLEPVGKCTHLKVIQDQFKPGDPSYEATVRAWPMILSNCKTLIETGKTLDLSSE
jgi:uncharacterized protein YndB with AHSA1/START domain